jgi:hypothetical protein
MINDQGNLQRNQPQTFTESNQFELDDLDEGIIN